MSDQQERAEASELQKLRILKEMNDRNCDTRLEMARLFVGAMREVAAAPSYYQPPAPPGYQTGLPPGYQPGHHAHMPWGSPPAQPVFPSPPEAQQHTAAPGPMGDELGGDDKL